jgi:hypothetical protein
MNAKIIPHPRNAAFVASNIYDEIPTTEKEFLHEMRKLIYDLNYTSPENLPCRGWSKIEIILYKYIRDTKIKWERNIMEIYNGEIYTNKIYSSENHEEFLE